MVTQATGRSNQGDTGVKSKIAFHAGNALLRMAAHYPTLAEIIFEQVQNALDCLAQNVWVDLNFKTRNLTVSDNGTGTTRDKFDHALISICSSNKSDDKLGQFGIGLISPLGKCVKFTFTSTSADKPQGYLRWTFVTDDIKKQSELDGIPCQSVPEFRFNRDRISGVPWRTQVKIFNFTTDKSLSRATIASLQEGILIRYSTAMRKRKSVVCVKITNADGRVEEAKIIAEEFEGKKLPIEYPSHPDSGKTLIRMYIANKTSKGRVGKVTFGQMHKDFRISSALFAKNAAEYLDREILNALDSGIFEGEILCEHAKLDASRRSFVQDDAFVAFCCIIESWYEKIGRSHTVQIKEEQQDDRYQRLGIRSMQVLEKMLEDPKFSFINDIVGNFKIGSIGSNHVDPVNKKKLGPQDGSSLSVHGAGTKHEKNTTSGQNPKTPDATGTKTEREGHTPLTVGGPRGRQRTKVTGNSRGLQFVYEEMYGSSRLWEFDNTTGTLRFNTRHPLWAQCEEDEKTLMRFQEQIAIKVLLLETVPVDMYDHHRKLFDDEMPLAVFLLTKGDEVSGRKPGAGLAKYNEEKKKKKAKAS